ncbi:acyltransferase family protein [Pseudomonas aeruginosa]|uniref:acyltransferase family protein n=1 Tax=Pseudomonas aeruginosa TaxID=287 RepID=UPI003D2862A6
MILVAPARFSHIDSMRGVAALLVVWMHTSEEFVKRATASFQDDLFNIASLLDFGRLGVVLFFAISGFVIPASLNGDRGTACRQFVIKRFFRLFPLYWLSIPIGLWACWAIWGKEASLATILWNLTMVQEAAGYRSIIGLYWTLQTELVFYGLCVLLFLTGLLRSAFALAGLVLLFSAIHLLPWCLGMLGITLPVTVSPSLAFLSLHLGVMCWGALFRMWYDDRKLHVLAKAAVVGYVGCWALLACYALRYHYLVGENYPLMRFVMPYFLGVFLFALLASVVRIRMAFLVWLGTISYSLYLLHPIAMNLLLWFVDTGAWWAQKWSLGAYMLCTVGLSIVLSAATYRLVEKPTMRIGGALATRRAAGALPKAA